ncbi:uncharacterized protein RCC_05313 [Ramularia collo-cygni]|uniref:Uncharacterized protein n=1 Tax=Ramularia collo-cygni TaxID=112498 RepID=A0A2D3UR14_9PEZI|nr:uncharacterized protein RCC_05313 [Ramularia collo-cygni]CZT19462.1 uncharacterized protein RCC_05313 [Ramularia collo-cygni]
MTSNGLPKVPGESATTCPIDEQALKDNPFLNKTVAQVIDWAQTHLHPERSLLINDQAIILDDRTARDRTCLLVSAKECCREPIPGLKEAPDAWIMIRSDFESSIVTIMAKATGVAGDDHFEPLRKEGHDGVVLRIREIYAKDS